MTQPTNATTTTDLREALAALVHDQWSGWMGYLFSQCYSAGDGRMLIPTWAIERWQRQAGTSYEALSEEEKNTDREEADKVLDVLRQRLGDSRSIASFAKRLGALLAAAHAGPVEVGVHPCADKDEAARYMAEHARNSSLLDVWSVFVPSESLYGDDGELLEAQTTAITGNGPLSEAHAYLYTCLHNNVAEILRLLTELGLGSTDANEPAS